MKNQIFFLVFGLVAQLSLAQVQVKVIDINTLSQEEFKQYHKQYPKVSALQDFDPKHADKVWHDFWHEFMLILKENKFDFGRKQKVYVHLHFNALGDLEILGYQFAGLGKKEKKQQFIAQLREFLSKYDFDLKSGTAVSQCGEIHILSNADIEEGK